MFEAGRYWRVLFPGLVVGVVLWTYLPALSHRYVWDDVTLFFENASLRQGWASFENIFAPVLAGTTYFRPLVLASFVVEFSLGGPQEVVSHGVNIALHLANVWLVYRLCLCFLVAPADHIDQNTARIQLRPVVTAAVAALIYGLHPALAEATAWVAGRFDLMMTFFALLAIAAALQEHRPTQIVGSGICTFCALLSKEMAITLCVVIPLLVYAQHNCYRGTQNARRWLANNWRAVMAPLVATAIYLGLRFVLVPGFIHVQPLDGAADSVPARIMLVARSLMFYVGLVFYPFDKLEPSHQLRHESLIGISPENMVAVSVVIGIALAFVATTLPRRKPGTSTLILAASLVSLTPVLNFVPLGLAGYIGANRFLALPLALLMIAIAVAVAPLAGGSARPSAKRISVATAVIGSTFVLVFLAGEAAFVRPAVRIWHSDLTLFAWTFEKHPDDSAMGIRYVAALNEVARHNPQAQPTLEATLQRVMNIPDVHKRLSEQESGFPVIVAALLTLGQTDAANWYTDRLPAIRDPDVRLQLLLQKIQLLQTDARKVEARTVLGAALAEYRRVNDHRRSTGLHLAGARQAILEGDAAALTESIEQLRRSTSPGHLADALAKLTKFHHEVCQRESDPVKRAGCLSQQIG